MKSTLIQVCTAAGLSVLGIQDSRGAVVQGHNSGGVNNAPAGFASQSTTAFGGTANRANDGNTDGLFANNSVTHSDDLGAPNQWQVDLGAVKPVEQVVLWNRADCCGDRLSNIRVGVYDAANVEVWGQNLVGVAVGLNQSINPAAGTLGQYVKVTQLGANNGGNFILSLAEVQVFDLNPSVFPNVALNKPAIQSTTGYGGDAGRAVDGNRNGDFFAGSVTHTGDSAADGWVAGNPVFWEVDLQGDFSINEIFLDGRTDCCPERFGNFRVSIINDGFEVWGMDNYVGAAGSNLGAPTGGWTTYEDTGGFIGTGDKVRISLIDGRNNTAPGSSTSGNLMLAEVRVFGQAIPEPGAAGLAALAGLTVLRRRRR